VGFVGYEAARRFERLPLAKNDPYAPFGLPEMVFGIYDTVVAFDHLRHTLTVLAHDDSASPGAAARMIDRVFAALDAPLPRLRTAGHRRGADQRERHTRGVHGSRLSRPRAHR